MQPPTQLPPTVLPPDAATPPPAGPHPPPPRYPLYADEPSATATQVLAPASGDAGTDAGAASSPGTATRRGHVGERRRSWLLPLVGLVAVALIAVLGVVLLVGDDEDAPSAEDPASASTEATEPGGDPTTAPPTGDGTPSATPNEPTDDIVGLVDSVEVPGSAPASTDARDGSRVTFGAANLTDGDPQTAWRVAGDATGEVLTLRFAEPVEVREVGLINGYAKSYPGYDGYPGNRRVLAVRWTFDDGSTHEQTFEESRSMQMVPIESRTTESIELELVEVSAPGRGPSARDFTAISEIGLGGATG